MILLIDNYDSFSYNLYQLIGSIQPDIKVVRNDAVTVAEIEDLKPEAIIISPGPGRPSQAGICIEAIQKLGAKIPILGVCLGHQSICEAYGATITYADHLMHGKQSTVVLDTECLLFRNCEKETKVARYHSLIADPATMPECLATAAETEDGEIMAVKHRQYNVYGVQFHPESIMTPEGRTMIENFLTLTGANKGH